MICVCFSTIVTNKYNTFNQDHNSLIVARGFEQTQLEIVLNTKVYLTNYLLDVFIKETIEVVSENILIYHVIFMGHMTWNFLGEKSLSKTSAWNLVTNHTQKFHECYHRGCNHRYV